MSARTERPAARILLLDPQERVLLFRFDAGDRPAFWATPGGALDPGEDFATGARRELLEETGLDLDCGPEGARRFVEFTTLEDVPVIADERYFLVRTEAAEIATSGHTELERRVMREWRWFTRAELAAHDEAIFPENLPAMLDLAAGIRIRAFRPADAPTLARLFHDAVHGIAAHHYTPAQVAAWAPAVPDPARFLARGADGRTLLVAEGADGVPLAYGDVEADGHIDHLFCRPDAAGAGVAARLYGALEEAARARGIARLYTEASEPARRFFERRGFALLHRRDFTLAGEPMHNYAMQKQLAPSGPDRMKP
jgi:8-oxo-dGTP pyrophosphatase MutT (NUDIX family)/ribosomal protein S18 acetylase RimI-like enzyme